MLSGSCYELLDYYSNGDASDWALAETGIIAMTNELGNESAMTMTFDIPSVRIEAQVILENIDLPFYLLKKASD